MRERFRLTRIGWVFMAAIAATGVLIVVAPTAGLVATVILVLVLLGALSEGVLGDSPQTHEAWASVEAERKREALHRRGRAPR
jgi:hypothetical protein